MNDPVNHPAHYTQHPSGIECIQITEHMNFNIGNAVKYLWRADLKNGLEDLEKAKWYIEREIQRQRGEPPHLGGCICAICVERARLETELKKLVPQSWTHPA